MLTGRPLARSLACCAACQPTRPAAPRRAPASPPPTRRSSSSSTPARATPTPARRGRRSRACSRTRPRAPHPRRRRPDAPEAVARRTVALARGGGIVVAAGGDGTLNTVAQAVLGSGCIFNVLPQGTFNYFGRVHGPRRHGRAARLLLGAAPSGAVVGLVNDKLFPSMRASACTAAARRPRGLEAPPGRSAALRRLRRRAGDAAARAASLATARRAPGRVHSLQTPTLFVGNNRLQMEQIGTAQALRRGRPGRHRAAPGRPRGHALADRARRAGALGDADNVTAFGFDSLTVGVLRFVGRRSPKVATDGEGDAGGCRSRFASRPNRSGCSSRTPTRDDRVRADLRHRFGTESAPVVALVRLVAAQAPALVVLSGDITQRARRSSDAARAFVDRLRVPATLVIPATMTSRSTTSRRACSIPTPGTARPSATNSSRVSSPRRCSSSAWKTTRRYLHERGAVSAAQVERVSRRLEQANARHSCASLSPPARVRDPAPGSRRGAARPRTRGAPWAAAGADLILGGHSHLPFVRALHEHHAGLARRVWVVQAGTAVSSRLRRGAVNSVNVAQPRRPGAGAAFASSSAGTTWPARRPLPRSTASRWTSTMPTQPSATESAPRRRLPRPSARTRSRPLSRCSCCCWWRWRCLPGRPTASPPAAGRCTLGAADAGRWASDSR